ncbi:hypothetical protein EZS27_009751 [termite gut metagenome]|uniref:Alpha-L-rhamnosidase C-terminal domain-containing protein n=1 Tax=termite gut metagenome TaxID=433724 RepID=A0A5J4S9E1_9ZZZZ
MKRRGFLTSTIGLSLLAYTNCFAQTIMEPYPPVSGSFSGINVPQSPDPMVSYRWANPQHIDNLEIYTVNPVSVQVDKAENVVINSSSIHVTGECSLMFDFGQINAAWLEFDSENLAGEIEASISEYNEVSYKTARPVRYGRTWRLELNKESSGFYEGVRFAWVHIRKLTQPADISFVRLVCQIRPSNYDGSFSCSDTMLTRIWYTGAYEVRMNLLKDYFGAILMNRGDRISWTGDAHVSQAVSMVAFGNYDFVKTNLRFTATQSNGIASYSLYWVLSLVDYCNYTGDKAILDEMLTNACAKLDKAYNHYGKNPGLSFYGWDERLGAGFAEPNCAEAQNAYKMLSIRAWNEFSSTMAQTGNTQLAAKYKQYADEKIAELRKDASWTSPLGVHAAADAVSAGFMNRQEQESVWSTAFSDRLQRVSYSPFNQYFIIRSLAQMQRHNEALSTIDDCWSGQIRYGGTTFFEVFRPSWNRVSKPNDAPINNQCGVTSLTHPWSAGVTKWLSEEVLGIKPIEAGFATFLVKPHLSSAITWVKGSVPTLHGIIAASFNILSGDMEVTVPSGTWATVAIPKAGRSIESVKFKGQKKFKKSEDEDYIYYSGLPGGDYQIQITYAGKLPKTPKEPFIYAGGTTVKEDLSTQGNWKGKYGSKGYILYNYDSINSQRSRLPDFIEVSFATPGPYYYYVPAHWVSGTTDSRALISDQDGDTCRSLGNVHCNLTMGLDIQYKKQQTYKVSLYFADWDKKEYRSAIEIFDLKTLNLLMPVYMVRDYAEGKYIIFEFDRSVRIRINQVRGSATLCGMFFD